MRLFPSVPLPWSQVAKLTYKKSAEDNFLDLAAQLSYYFFLALFPAILFLLALASFFPLQNVADGVNAALGRVVSADVSRIIEDQIRRLSNNENGGLLTFGVLGALWSSSAALVSIVTALNSAYDITEGRPWWRVRLTAISLTIGVALLVLIGLTLVLAGPTVATYLGDNLGFGQFFKWAWLILQWPLVFMMITTALGLVYFFGPDAEQDWVWVTPGAVTGTVLWLLASLGFKIYVSKFTDYDASYGAVGGVIVTLLWFYISGMALVIGAEMNAAIEHASPYGKAPGQKSAAGRRMIGIRAARAFAKLHHGGRPTPAGEAAGLATDARERAAGNARPIPQSPPSAALTARPPADGSASPLPGLLFAASVLGARWLSHRAHDDSAQPAAH